MPDTVPEHQHLIRRVDWGARAGLFLYAASALAMPVCLVQISADLNLSNTQAGSFGLITSVQSIVMLLLAAVLTARYGKIRLLRVGMLLAGAGLAVFTQADGYLLVLAALLIIGLGTGMIEALVTPLVEDLHVNDDGKQQNQLHAFWPLGVLVSTLAIGELLTHGVHWRTIYAGLAVITAAAALIYPGPRQTAALNLPRSRADFSHAKDILRQPRFAVLGAALFFAAGAEGGITFWTAAYIQRAFETEPRAGAWGTALFALGMAAGRMACARLAPGFGLRRIMLACAAGSLAFSAALPLIDHLAGFLVMMLLMGLSIACFWPSLQTYGARAIRADPTMLMILLSCFGLPGFTSAIFVMGYASDAVSLQWAFVAVPVYLLALLAVLLIDRPTGSMSGSMTGSRR